MARLDAYEALLRQWQPAVNLVAPSTLDHIWERHFADSAQLLDIAPPSALAWTDLGSGAGFPGLVLAVLLVDRPGAHVALIESDQRKAAFLREAARAMSVSTSIFAERIENVATHGRVPKTDVVTARALAPLPRLLDWARPFFHAETMGLFLKGQDVEREIQAAKGRLAFSLDVVPSRTGCEGRVVVIRKLRATKEG